MKYTAISQLKLTNFRNHQLLNLDFKGKVVAIFGNNGVGKTNILEAISLLGKGQGLKNGEFEEMINHQKIAQPLANFTIFSIIKNHPEIENLGTSFAKAENKRIFQVNHKILTNRSKNINFPAIIWLTPQMDNLFCSTKILRRKFLDKIVADINIDHNSHLNAYQHSIRERINLLNRFSSQSDWLDIVERKIAELGTVIAVARNQTINYLNQAISQNNSNFTKTRIVIIGELEQLAQNHKAIEVEEIFIQKLKANRGIDSRSGRTNFGVHRSDFTAILLDKNIEAKFCSTGEQKSILIALTFARVKIFPLLGLPSAVLLLDEIVSHLDNQKRTDLLQEISNLNCQSFLTATNQNFFVDLYRFEQAQNQFLEIN